MGLEWGQKPQDVLWVQMRSRIRTCSSSIFHHLDTCLTALRRAITKTQSPIICPAYSQLPSVNAVCQYNSSRGIPWVWDPLCLSLHPLSFSFPPLSFSCASQQIKGQVPLRRILSHNLHKPNTPLLLVPFAFRHPLWPEKICKRMALMVSKQSKGVTDILMVRLISE